MEVRCNGIQAKRPQRRRLASKFIANEVKIRFDADELASFFDGFLPLDTPPELWGSPVPRSETASCTS